ncbi:MAG: molybdopterin molybdotransferase MoeA [Bacteroidetes bacterium]|nr:molybdopterin molybdotransferase MoeA [Bacteroidota bacterium]
MISVTEAWQRLLVHAQSGPVQILALADALGAVLAADIISPFDSPDFDMSAMDGYAVRMHPMQENTFLVTGEIQAGDTGSYVLNPGEAVRIFTGGMVPATADAVVMQEWTTETNGSLMVKGEIVQGANIRRRGSQLGKGDIALSAGTEITAAGIGLLASLGQFSIPVFSRPSVSIITTGNELLQPGDTLVNGQIYDSNTPFLQAALQETGIRNISCFRATDQRTELDSALDIALELSDFLLITGGISVGKYDLVYDALNSRNIDIIFYKISQKPGKPILAGKLGEKWVFALPGNPASAGVCFYEYVYPVLRKYMGFSKPFLKRETAILSHMVKNKSGRAAFLRAAFSQGKVQIPAQQDSHILQSFAMANCLVYLPQDTELLQAGDKVEIHWLP